MIANIQTIMIFNAIFSKLILKSLAKYGSKDCVATVLNNPPKDKSCKETHSHRKGY